MNSLQASRGSHHCLRGDRELRGGRGEMRGEDYSGREEGPGEAPDLILGDERYNQLDGGRAGGIGCTNLHSAHSHWMDGSAESTLSSKNLEVSS